MALLGLALSLTFIIVSMAIGVAALYLGIKLYDSLTPEMEEWKEVKKGNMAAGILLSAIMIILLYAVGDSISSFYTTLNTSNYSNLLTLVLVQVFDAFLSVVFAVFSIWIALKLINSATPDIDEMEEIKKGNISMALVTSAAVFALSFVIVKSSLILRAAIMNLIF